MSSRPLLLAAIALIAGAHLVRDAAMTERESWPRLVAVPFAPSPAAAPFVSLGYRELAADLLWIRVIGYFGGTSDTADGVRSLVEGTLALDPYFRPAYDVGGQMMERADIGVTNASHLAAIAVLERGMTYFPDRWQYPYLAGESYLVELETDDPAQRRAWTERGVALLEKAVRMPGAPSNAATYAAHYQEQLGKHEAAVNHLREMILITTDTGARKSLIEQLAKLVEQDATDVAVAMLDERDAFTTRWQATRPALPASMYLLLGARRDPYLPPSALALDRDLIGTDAPEPLEPLMDR